MCRFMEHEVEDLLAQAYEAVDDLFREEVGSDRGPDAEEALRRIREMEDTISALRDCLERIRQNGRATDEAAARARA